MGVRLISLRLARPVRQLAAAFSLALASTPAAAAYGAEDWTARYAEQVAPILAAKCGACHGESRRKADLDLSELSGLLAGGESGPSLVPGAADESLLVEMVETRAMPLEGRPELTDDEIAAIRDWVSSGDAAAWEALESVDVDEQDVTPAMLLRCTVCHGARTREANLDLRTRKAMLAGGDSGPAIVPGDAEASLLLQRIDAGEMPPPRRLVEASVKPMAASEVERLRSWIAAGAPGRSESRAPESERSSIGEEERKFWSFRAPQLSDVPAAEAAARNAVDAFLLAELDRVGLSFSPEADRPALLRRIYFDLIGLPPTPEEATAFLEDDRPDAYERLVDRLLASPRYGERWGRYWLDLAGYSDSEGVQHADPIRPHAYRYRDYVIQSLNADKPYDQFLTEQIAGDELSDHAHAEIVTDAMADQLVATGFLRMATDGTFAGITNFVPDRLKVIDEELEVLGSAVLGLTIGCARCHSHKFDPISQRDYFGLVAMFKGAFDEHDWLRPRDPSDLFAERNLPYVATAERVAWRRGEDRLTQSIADAEAMPANAGVANCRPVARRAAGRTAGGAARRPGGDAGDRTGGAGRRPKLLGRKVRVLATVRPRRACGRRRRIRSACRANPTQDRRLASGTATAADGSRPVGPRRTFSDLRSSPRQLLDAGRRRDAGRAGSPP